MKAYYCDEFVLPLPDGHRFPMEKYALLRQRVLAERSVRPADLRVPEAATDTELRRVHDEAWVRAVTRGTLSPAAVRQIGFPWSPALVERSRRSVGGTLAACRTAVDDGVCVNLAGGTHHAHPAGGAGFCVFNDAAVAIRALQAEGRIRRAAVVDCDVHQGDGTAAAFAGDASVFTFSIHGAHNYPFRKVPGDLDVALPDGTTDAPYMSALDAALERVQEAGRPELVVYIAGADPFVGDRLGRLALTAAGLAARDERVLGWAWEAGIPVAVVMGGGYAVPVAETVAIHARTVRLAAERNGTRDAAPRARTGTLRSVPEPGERHA